MTTSDPAAPKLYAIEYTTSAAKELAKLDRNVIKPIAAAIKKLAEEPRPHGSTKLAGSDRLRIRVGDYRVLYVIDDAVVTVTVVKVGHRRDVYER